LAQRPELQVLALLIQNARTRLSGPVVVLTTTSRPRGRRLSGDLTGFDALAGSGRWLRHQRAEHTAMEKPETLHRFDRGVAKEFGFIKAEFSRARNFELCVRAAPQSARAAR